MATGLAFVGGLIAKYGVAAAAIGGAVHTGIEARKSRKDAESRFATQQAEAEKAKQDALNADQQARDDADKKRRGRIKELQEQGRASTFNTSPFAAAKPAGQKRLLGS